MAVADSVALLAGSQFTWKASGGTYAITCTTLPAAGTRQGVKSGSLLAVPSGLATSVLPEVLEIMFQIQMVSAPTAGGTVELYFGFSDSATAGTDNPANLSGTDAVGPNVDTLGQLTYAGSVVLSNNIGTGVQLAYLMLKPIDQYMSPVVYNNGSVGLDTTASHTSIVVTPWYRVIST